MARLSSASGFVEPLPKSWCSQCCKTFAFVFLLLHLPVFGSVSHLSFFPLLQSSHPFPIGAILEPACTVIICWLFKDCTKAVLSISLAFPSEKLYVLANCQGSPGAAAAVSILSLWVGKLNQRKLKLSGFKLDIRYLCLWLRSPSPLDQPSSVSWLKRLQGLLQSQCSLQCN